MPGGIPGTRYLITWAEACAPSHITPALYASNTLWDSTYACDGIGRIASVDIDDGRRRTVSFAYTPEGQIVRRKERSAVTNNPEDQRYFVAAKQMGEITS